MAERNRKKPPAARVEAILARNAATGVIFRRGPSRFVRMLKWNLRNDGIEGGQWIEARVHVDRSDISPDGELVAAFVASYRRKPGTWTAISRPPYFTALAVWPKGDTWGGGGLFGSDTHLFLWHDTEVKYGVDQFKLLDDFTLPKRLRVEAFADHAPVPTCDIGQSRMVLSAWRFVQRYVWHQGQSAFAEPEIMARPLDHPKQPRFELRRWRMSFDITRAEVHDLTTGTQRDIGRVDWVDADRNGDVLWSADGKLFRLAGPSRQGMNIDAEPKLVADLNDMAFEAIEAPKRALRWP
jgi:hypothetical protein